MKNQYTFSRMSGTLSHVFLALSCMFTANAMAADSKYEAAVAKWQSHEDVAKWLKSNFEFDKNRQLQLQSQLKETGPENVLTRKPETFFENHKGSCRDSAGFSRDALNKINPDYKARYIFIKNKYGPPNHWVTGFNFNSKLYVIDYGTGPDWWAMTGTHGPYESLDDYKTFLASLNVRGFAPEMVKWRDLPGQLD